MFITLSPYYLNISCILTISFCFEVFVATYYSSTKIGNTTIIVKI